MISLTVGCPVYNEEAAIETVAAEVAEKIAAITDDFEFLIVNDGSTDGTAAALDRIRLRDPRVRVIHHPYNLGFRGFARTLPNNARKEWFLGISGDGEMDMDAVAAMVARAQEGCDVVMGVRTAKPNYNVYRKFVSWGFNAVVRHLYDLDLQDIGGLKLWRTSILREPVISESPFMNAERLIMASRRGAKIGFVPVQQRPRIGGRAKGGNLRWVRGALVDLARVTWRMRAAELLMASTTDGQPVDASDTTAPEPK